MGGHPRSLSSRLGVLSVLSTPWGYVVESALGHCQQSSCRRRAATWHLQCHDASSSKGEAKSNLRFSGLEDGPQSAYSWTNVGKLDFVHDLILRSLGQFQVAREGIAMYRFSPYTATGRPALSGVRRRSPRPHRRGGGTACKAGAAARVAASPGAPCAGIRTVFPPPPRFSLSPLPRTSSQP